MSSSSTTSSPIMLVHLWIALALCFVTPAYAGIISSLAALSSKVVGRVSPKIASASSTFTSKVGSKLAASTRFPVRPSVLLPRLKQVTNARIPLPNPRVKTIAAGTVGALAVGGSLVAAKNYHDDSNANDSPTTNDTTNSFDHILSADPTSGPTTFYPSQAGVASPSQAKATDSEIASLF